MQQLKDLMSRDVKVISLTIRRNAVMDEGTRRPLTRIKSRPESRCRLLQSRVHLTRTKLSSRLYRTSSAP